VRPLLLILTFALAVVGCGPTTPTTASAPAAQPGGALPPEVELDPASAAEKHKSKKK